MSLPNTDDRTKLSLGLDDFEVPKEADKMTPQALKALEDASQWPSREPQPKQAAAAPAEVEGHLYIRVSMQAVARFKKLCKDDRRTYGDMLTILMDHFETQGR